jgi:hypothetical protein
MLGMRFLQFSLVGLRKTKREVPILLGGLTDCKSGGVADNVSHRMKAESFALVSGSVPVLL